MKTPPAIEVLESRIAPATFLVSGGSGGTALKIYKLTGSGPVDAVTNAADPTSQGALALTFSGADATALLNSGDKLYYDTNGDQQWAGNATEPLLVQVYAGKARVFWTDGATGATGGKLEISELTGILVSNGTKLEVKTDVFGSVLGVLNNSGNFFYSQGQLNAGPFVSIAALKVAGAVRGDIGATGSIGTVVLGLQMTSPNIVTFDPHSVFGVYAGDQVIQSRTDFDGGTVVTHRVQYQIPPTPPYPFPQNGGAVAGLTAAGAVESIYAGKGSDNPTGLAKAGGSISGILISGQKAGNSLTIVGGTGGNGKSGGPGGNVQLGIITDGGAPGVGVAALHISGGTGGDGSALAGGAGGSITGTGGSNIALSGDFNDLEVIGGMGGQGGTAGGAGGAVSGLKLKFYGALSSYSGMPGAHRIEGGTGGSAAGTGGAGGAVQGISYQVLAGGSEQDDVNIHGGNGGVGLKGGAGGGLKTTTGFFAGTIFQHLGIGGGDGGNATKTGGAGGSTSMVNFTLDNATFNTGTANDVALTAGNGGDLLGAGALAGSQAGAGGSIDTSIFRLNHGSGTQGVIARVEAGNGGAAGATTGGGGKGGDVTGTTLKVGGTHVAVEFIAGTGANAGTHPTSNASGGAGGKLDNDSIQILGNIDSYVYIYSGGAGTGAGTGAGAAGGNINHFTLTGGSVGELGVSAVDGGNGGGAGGVGGQGGSVTNSSFQPATVVAGITLLSGYGGGANPQAVATANFGTPGNGGAITDVKIITGNVGTSVNGGDVTVTAGTGGATDKAGIFAGSGGSIGDLQIQTQAVAGSIFVLAGEGGTGTDGNSITPTAKGGAGGKIEDSSFAFGVIGGRAQFAGGNGGSGTAGGLGGLVRNNILTLAGIVTGVQGSEIFDPLLGPETVQRGLDFTAGNGGDAGLPGVASAPGDGGKGGDFTDNKVTANGPLNTGDPSYPLRLTLRAGDGGDSGLSGGNSGNGGLLSDVDFSYFDAEAYATIRGGDGGDALPGTAGAGGNLSNVNVNHQGPDGFDISGRELLVRGGNGGAVRNGKGNGGNGGSASFVTVDNTGSMRDLRVGGGNGGSAAFAFNPQGPDYIPGLPTFTGGNGSGGNGGQVTDSTLTNYSDLDYLVTFAGSGGAAGDTAGAAVHGGLGGSNLDNSITSYSQFANVEVFGGNGGDATVSGGTGGDSGAVMRITLDVPNTEANVRAVSGGAGVFKGGNGGSVDQISGVIGSGSIIGGSGGVILSAAANGSVAGLPGNGGSVTNVNLQNVVDAVSLWGGSGSTIMDAFVNGTELGFGGQGASVEDVQVVGEIFELFGGAGGGGPTGTHGSVKRVTAGLIDKIHVVGLTPQDLWAVSVLEDVTVNASAFIGEAVVKTGGLSGLNSPILNLTLI